MPANVSPAATTGAGSADPASPNSAGASAAPSVLGYWLVRVTGGSNSGHSALIWTGAASPHTQPNLSAATLSALGARRSDPFTFYYLGGDPKSLNSELYKALGALNVSVDQLPVLPSSGTPSQILGKTYIKALNFDVLAPIGTTPSGVDKATLPVANAATSVTGAISSLGSTDWQQLIIRALEALVGIAALMLGLQALTGTGTIGSPVAAVKRHVL